VDAAQRLLTRNGEALTLPPKTFDLLVLLAENKGRVLSKPELMQALWPDTFVEEANLSCQISALRKALGVEGIAWIDTLPKHGYRFTAPVTLADNDEPLALLSDVPLAAARRRSLMPWPAVSAMMAIIAAIGWWFAWRAMRTVDHPLIRLSVDLGPDAVVDSETGVAISPDGMRIVFPARGPGGKQQLVTRLLSQAPVTLLPETQNGREPFFSPDGQWIGFFAEGKLKKIPVQGGTSVTLCDAAFGGGATWGEDGTIVGALLTLSGLWRVSAAGGRPQPLSRLGPGELTHRWPQWLPGGKAVLFTSNTRSFGFDDATIQVLSLKTGQTRTLVRGGYRGRYLPVNESRGVLVYVHQGMLFGVPFDPVRLEIRGVPLGLVEDLASNPNTGGGQFGFSREGTLVYLAGQAAPANWQVVWMDSSGKTQPLLATPGHYAFPRFSPDGRRLALTRSSALNDIVVYDWERDRMSRLPFGQHAFLPIWAPDGKHILFSSSTGSAMGLWWIRSDGSAEAQRLLEAKIPTTPYSISPDGHRLAYTETNPDTAQDLWTLPLDTSDPEHPKAGKPELFLRTPFAENEPMFSPDGRWIAYRSTESGNNEIYVRPFPPGAGKWLISTGDGLHAVWSINGRELFYETLDNRIMVVDYGVNSDSFLPGKPRLWSDKQIYNGGVTNWALAPDGKRFAVFLPPEVTSGEQRTLHMTFLLNFFDELRRRMP